MFKRVLKKLEVRNCGLQDKNVVEIIHITTHMLPNFSSNPSTLCSTAFLPFMTYSHFAGKMFAPPGYEKLNLLFNRQLSPLVPLRRRPFPLS
ncbi:MAG: hypothetical protein ACQEQV_10115, partial [Fibrobacterota bacterium]